MPRNERLTPLELETLLHFYYTPDGQSYLAQRSRAHGDAMEKFTRLGFLRTFSKPGYPMRVYHAMTDSGREVVERSLRAANAIALRVHNAEARAKFDRAALRSTDTQGRTWTAREDIPAHNPIDWNRDVRAVTVKRKGITRNEYTAGEFIPRGAVIAWDSFNRKIYMRDFYRVSKPAPKFDVYIGGQFIGKGEAVTMRERWRYGHRWEEALKADDGLAQVRAYCVGDVALDAWKSFPISTAKGVPMPRNLNRSGLSCVELEVLLHHYYTPDGEGRIAERSRAHAEAMRKFMKLGFLRTYSPPGFPLRYGCAMTDAGFEVVERTLHAGEKIACRVHNAEARAKRATFFKTPPARIVFRPGGSFKIEPLVRSKLCDTNVAGYGYTATDTLEEGEYVGWNHSSQHDGTIWKAPSRYEGKRYRAAEKIPAGAFVAWDNETHRVYIHDKPFVGPNGRKREAVAGVNIEVGDVLRERWHYGHSWMEKSEFKTFEDAAKRWRDVCGDERKPKRRAFASLSSWSSRYDLMKVTGRELFEDGALTRGEWKKLFDVIFKQTDSLRDYLAVHEMRRLMLRASRRGVTGYGRYWRIVRDTKARTSRRIEELKL